MELLIFLDVKMILLCLVGECSSSESMHDEVLGMKCVCNFQVIRKNVCVMQEERESAHTNEAG